MSQWNRNLYILWFCCFICSTSYTLVVPFMPLFLKELAVGTGIEAWAGFILSANFLISAVMAPIWGSLADRYGRKIMLVRAGIGIGSCYILQYFVTSPVQLLGLRMLNGLFSGFIPSATALIATNTPEEHIGTSLGILQTASAAGSIMGPLFGGIMAQMFGTRMTFLLAGSFLFVITVVAGLLVRESAPRNPKLKVAVVSDFKVALANTSLRTMMFTALFIQAALSVLQPVLSLQIAKLGGADTASLAAGIVYSAAGVAAVIGAPVWGSRGKRAGYKRMLVFALLAAGLLNLPLAVVTSIVVFGILRFAVGFFTAGVQLSVNAITARSVPPEFRGRAFGILTSSNQFGSMFGPMIGGLVGTAFGLEATFVAAALILVAGGGAAQRLLPADSEVAQPRAYPAHQMR